MLRLLRPNEYHDSVFEINLEKLKKRGIAGFVIDLDNTLMPWNELVYTEEIFNWIDVLKTNDFKVCLLSNNGKDRGTPIAEKFNLPLVAFAKKPSKNAFKKAMKVLGTKKSETVVIGDQLFTDVLGGNRFGLYTILVKPISEKEFWGTRIVRRIERVVFKILGLN